VACLKFVVSIQKSLVCLPELTSVYKYQVEPPAHSFGQVQLDGVHQESLVQSPVNQLLT